MKKHIPNFVTLLNLFSGCLAVMMAVEGQFVVAAAFLALGIVFDFFDGFLARLLKVQSPIGLQLDSLADCVTSGVVPGTIMFKLLSSALAANQDISSHWGDNLLTESFKFPPLALFGFIITLASAYRLAKFNLDEDQQSYFKGLPTPANALLIVSLPIAVELQSQPIITNLILNPWFLIGLSILSSYVLVSNIPLFSLKFKSYALKDNLLRYGFLLCCLLSLVIFQYAAIPLIIISYVMVSIIFKKFWFEK